MGMLIERATVERDRRLSGEGDDPDEEDQEEVNDDFWG